ncbi:MAG: hypothetical protein J6V45_01075 [Kiritimatiellae bacterium]|nr:hypothetical protein [Kiritimatiellia bacterium]
MKKLIALLILPFSLFADELDTAAVTNTWIVSNSTNIKAWTRQAVMIKPDKTIIDPSGIFVDTATAAAESNAVDKVSSLADAAKLGMESAIEGLESVTNQVPENAYQVSLAIPPPQLPKSLMGFVVKESTDGVTDTQWVWYSQTLKRKPVRHVVYRTPTGDISQNAEWVDWTEAGETISAYGRTWSSCHKCTIARPAAARNITAVSRLNEVFGDKNGFDFGGVVVFVADKPAVTTNLVNSVTGETLVIQNGFIKKQTKEADE